MGQHDPSPNNELGQPAGAPEKLSSRLYRYLLFFLDAIGLRQERRVDQSTQIAKLRVFHTEFRKLLSANNSYLEALGDLEKKRLGLEFFDRDFIKRKVVRAIADIHAMVGSLNAIADNRYAALDERLDEISSKLTCAFDESCAFSDPPLVMNLKDVASIHGDLVGGKMANLGELRVKLLLPAPDGMVVTTEGYRQLVEKGGLRSWIQDKHVEFSSIDDAEQLSATLQEQILSLEIPAELKTAIHEAYDRLCEGGGEQSCPVAVRSSAVGEDSEYSFAGQFLSLLNVTRENLCSAYLQVLASLYSPEAVYYRQLHGIAGETAEMAVGFIRMVDAQASGVIFTRDPNEPGSKNILIQAVRGLGIPLVDGRVSPEVVYVPRNGNSRGLVRHSSTQKFRTGPAIGNGLVEEAVSAEEAATPCISDDEACRLAEMALAIETHFGSPQDIEWAADAQRRLMILQSRPLRLPRNHQHMAKPIAGALLLLSGGETACPGAGAGRAVHLDTDADFESFPEGAVLVARRSSPKFVRLMSKTRAIITDVGSTTGHMASLAREFGVPTLVNTGVATKDIAAGELITVDATNGYVYRGEIPELIQTSGKSAQMGDAGFTRITPEYRLLDSVLELIAPLNLTDPSSAEFAPWKCTTLHDIARFVHEKSYQEMFMLGENVGDLRSASLQLEVPIPVDLYVVDLGGGLKGTPRDRKIRPLQIASVPFAAVIRGMMHEKLSRLGPRPMDVRGLFSIMMRHAMTSPEQEHSFREPCYALISDSYLNYTARVGYHFSVVDTYCSRVPNKNYISIMFRGGAADYVRRNRRVRAIGGILRQYGFSVEINHDMAVARLSKTSMEEAINQLEMVGSLFQFFRQMDAAMTDEESVSLYRDAFLNGDYGLERFSGERPRTGKSEAL